MRLESVEHSLREIQEILQQVLARRERILKETRDVILASSRAIISLHGGKLDEASSEIVRAGKLLADLRTAAEGGLARYLVSPETEFVEASTVESIVRGRAIPDRSSLGVSAEAYLLGLLDTVGELKRLVLVSLTHGDVEEAKNYFGIMERLYSVLSGFAVFDNVVSGGVRRKIDVARMITEDTRGSLAEESRRGSLLASIAELQREMGIISQLGRERPQPRRRTEKKRKRKKKHGSVDASKS